MYVFIKFNKDGEWTDGLLAFKKSGLSAAGRPLQKMIKQFRYGPDVTHDLQPSILSQTYHLTSAVSSNSENQWWNWKVAPGRVLDIEDDKALLEDCLTSMKEAALMLPAPQEVQLLETTEAVF